MKRILSIILCAAMVISLVPVVFAETVAENGNTVYNYVFSAKAIGVAAGTSITTTNDEADAMVSAVDGGVVDYDDIIASESDKWDILALRSAAVKTLRNEGLYYRAAKGDALVPANNGVAIKVHVPETGKYIPTVLLDGAANGGIVDAYFFSEKEMQEKGYTAIVNEHSIKSIISGEKFTPIGSVDTYSSGAKDDYFTGPEININAEAVSLEAGDHYLITGFNGANETVLAGTSNYYYMNLKGVSLEKIAPASVSVTADATEIDVGGTVTVSAKAYDADNNELPDEIVYSSSDDKIATVDSATGTVSAVAPGSATITATVKGTEISSSVTITVTKTYKYIFSGTASGYANGTSFTNNDIIDYENVEAKGISAPWDYIGGRSIAVAQLRTNGFYARSATDNLGDAKNGIVFKIKVSENGVYAPTLKYSQYHNGGVVAVIFAPAAEVDALSFDMTNGGGSGGIVRAIGKYAAAGSIDTKNTAITNENFGTISPYSMENINLVAGEYYVVFTLLGNSQAPVSGNYVYYLINSIELKKVGTYIPAKDTELSRAFDYTEETYSSAPLSSAKVNTFTATLGEKKDSTADDVTSTTVTLGEKYTVTAPAAETGCKFLYWAKGMSTDKKQIVSYNETYTFVPTVENTYLIAVYEPVSGEATAENKAEFYNANGQLIETLTKDGNAPELPGMAGYGDASGWQLYGSDEVISGGAPVTVSGTKLYVAKYGDEITVKVNDDDVIYGEKVSFTAEPEIGEIFKCWTKDGVIVSTEETYEFLAWESCEVEPIYVKELPVFNGKAMKIFIDTFSAGKENAIMAEFIGMDDAVEKGIMFGSKKIAMTSGENQFTVINDENETDIKGYAIFKDGTIVYDK